MYKKLAGKDKLQELEPARPAAGDRPEQSPVWTNALEDGASMTTVDGCATLYEAFVSSIEKYADRPALGKRVGDGPYQWMSYKALGGYVSAVASAMIGAGLPVHGRAAVYGPNSPEWMLAMQACNATNVYCVPLYDTLGENAVEFILNHSEATLCFCDQAKVGKLAKAIPKATGVKTIVYWGSAEEADLAALKKVATVHTLDEFVAQGEAAPQAPRPPKPDDLCTIMYTSGTTGDPKGVEITHKNCISTCATLRWVLAASGWEVGAEDSFISYLPLAHIFDRVTEDLFLCCGAAIGYWRGDAKTLLDDVGLLKPTLFAGVPRIFDRIYAKILEAVKGSAVKRFLFNWGYGRKSYFMKKGMSHSKAGGLFDKILFKKFAGRLGGRVKVMVSGAAPLSAHVEEFLRVGFCAGVVQGYGLTESCAASFLSILDDMSGSATVGIPLPGVRLRLEAVPDMNYSPSNAKPSGEVMIKSNGLYQGYYKRKDLTDDAIDADGWFHTGDIGEIQPNGYLKIVDRKKNIFKLSQGEYVAVEKVESIYKKNTLADMLWVYGNSFESFLVGVVVPNEAKLLAWAKSKGKSGSYADLCKDADAKKWVLGEIAGTGRAEKLKGFEIIKAVHLEPEPFSVETDCITPTFKLKRPKLLKYYKAEVDAMYAAFK